MRNKSYPLIVLFVGVALALISVISGTSFYFYNADIREANIREIENTVEIASNMGAQIFVLPIELGDKDTLKQMASQLLQYDFFEQIEVFDKDSNPIISVSKNRKEKLHTFAIRRDIVRRVSDLGIPGRLVERSAPKKEVVGKLTFHISTKSFEDHHKNRLNRAVPLFSLAIVVCLTLVFILYAHILRNFRRLNRGLSGIAAGDYSVRLSSKGMFTEVEVFVEQVNKMACAVEAHQKQLLENLRQLQISNDALHESESRAKYAEASVRRFLRIGSHEIRNPVNGIFGLIEMLMNDYHRLSISDTKMKERLITSAALLDQMQFILDRLFNLSQLNDGVEVINSEAFNVQTLANRLRIAHEGSALEKRIALNISVEAEQNSEIVGDLFKIQQIAMNLVQNAIKFTSAGLVDVLLRVECLDTSDAVLAINVADTGPGIADDDLDKIFDEFFTQTPGQQEDKPYSGWGLGLALVKRLSEMLDGSVFVSSQIGRGSVFAVRIPVKIKQIKLPNVIAETKQKKNVAGDELKILVVDDVVSNAEIIAERLQLDGAIVDVCTNAFIASARVYEGNKYDIAIIDYRMPGTNGVELAEELQKLDPNIYLVGLTGDTSREVCDAMSGVMDTVIYKPVRADDLAKLLMLYRDRGNYIGLKIKD